MSSRSDKTAVVVGAGIVGVLTSWRLLREGWTVVQLEARHLGAGSSSRSAACARQQFGVEGTVRAMIHSIRWYEAFQERFTAEGPAMRQFGYLYPYWEGDTGAFAAARARVANQQLWGLKDVELWDDSVTVLKQFPFLNPAGLVGAHFCASDGLVFPDRVYSVVHEHCRRYPKYRVHMDAPVTGIECHGGRATAVATPKGKFGADVFINCTNAWAVQLEQMLHCDAQRLLPVAPLRRYLWFFPHFRELLMGAHSDFDPMCFPMTVFPSGTYVRPEGPAADQLLMGHAHQVKPLWDLTHEVQDKIAPEAEELSFTAWGHLVDAIPMMADAGIGATTSGFYGATPDHNPFIGRDLVYQNWFRAVGFSGHGVMMAPFVAEAVLAAVKGERVVRTVAGDVDLSMFAQDRSFNAHSEHMVI